MNANMIVMIFLSRPGALFRIALVAARLTFE